MHAIAGLWRWRRNPLCRRSDLREAWLALGAVLLTVLLAPCAGSLGMALADDSLRATIAEQQRTRHQVWATSESVHHRAPEDSDPESAAKPTGRRTVAYWAGPDGSTHKGTVPTPRHVQPGERFRIWTNGRGTPTRPPMDPRTASSYAALAGLAACAAAGVATEGARRLVLRQLLRRRYEAWDEAWARIGPDWGRKGADS